MPLPLPNLDTRKWADLVDEARALIPLYAPRWTDHNLTDPGITIIDLLAWITEMDVYALNRVPERHLRKFLALIGAGPKGPQPATATLAVRFGPLDPLNPAPPPSSVDIPDGVEITAITKDGRRVPFRTLESLHVIPAQLISLLSEQTPGARTDLLSILADGNPVALLGDDPRPGATLLLGFDEPLPPSVDVSIGFAFSGGRSGPDERQRILDEIAAQRELCRLLLGNLSCDETDTTYPSTDNQELLTHHSVRLRWRYYTGAGAWRTLDPTAGEVRDDTRAFTLDGTVKVRLPEAMDSESGGRPFYLSVSLVSGDYDTPPMLAGVFPNALPVEQAIEVTATVGPSDGRPNQHFSLPKRAISAGSLRVTSSEPVPGAPGTTVSREWEVRPDLDASSDTHSHLVADESLAEIAFGDGDHGRIPPTGSLIETTYLATQADKGNLEAGQALRYEVTIPLAMPSEDAALLAFAIPFGSSGGAAREMVSQAAARAVRFLQTPTRATTPGDYEYLAGIAPGTAIARVRALPGTHPSFPCMKAPGVVTVLIVPDQRRPAPRPSAGLLDLVRRYLDRRRTLGTHIEVVGPQYARVTVHAVVKLMRGAGAERVRQDVLSALDTFLHPLKGGPAVLAQTAQAASKALESSQRSAVPTNMPAPGIMLITSQQPLTDELPATPPPLPGWPFGRDVYRAEILQLIDGVAGVDNVLKLEMSVEGGEAGCGNICVGPTSLVVSGPHTVEVER